MQKNYPHTEKDKLIVVVVYQIIMRHRGEKNRISRNLLRSIVADQIEMDYTNITDREIRAAIEFLRNKTKQGSLILSTCGNAGYWIAESLDEFMTCIGEDRRRALSILVRIHKQKKVARTHFIEQERLPLFEFADQINCFEELEITT